MNDPPLFRSDEARKLISPPLPHPALTLQHLVTMDVHSLLQNAQAYREASVTYQRIADCLTWMAQHDRHWPLGNADRFDSQRASTTSSLMDLSESALLAEHATLSPPLSVDLNPLFEDTMKDLTELLSGPPVQSQTSTDRMPTHEVFPSQPFDFAGGQLSHVGSQLFQEESLPLFQDGCLQDLRASLAQTEPPRTSLPSSLPFGLKGTDDISSWLGSLRTSAASSTSSSSSSSSLSVDGRFEYGERESQQATPRLLADPQPHRSALIGRKNSLASESGSSISSSTLVYDRYPPLAFHYQQRPAPPPPPPSQLSRLSIHIAPEDIVPRRRRNRKRATPLPKSKTTRAKRPPTSFLLFCEDQRPLLKCDHPELDPKLVMHLLAKQWKELSFDDRLSYDRRALALKEKFNAEQALMHSRQNAPVS